LQGSDILDGRSLGNSLTKILNGPLILQFFEEVDHPDWSYTSLRDEGAKSFDCSYLYFRVFGVFYQVGEKRHESSQEHWVHSDRFREEVLSQQGDSFYQIADELRIVEVVFNQSFEHRAEESGKRRTLGHVLVLVIGLALLDHIQEHVNGDFECIPLLALLQVLDSQAQGGEAKGLDDSHRLVSTDFMGQPKIHSQGKTPNHKKKLTSSPHHRPRLSSSCQA